MENTNERTPAGFRWLLHMAWRDSRRNRARLLLFILSIILGIAALVAIYSLGDNLEQNVDEQAATLIGADLELSDNKAPTPQVQQLLDSLGGRRSEERAFASMIYFLRNGGTRLVQVRALQGDYPYYGTLETMPAAAAKSFRTRREALVDKSLMLQFGAKTGDSIQVGSVHFAIAGTLNKAPGQTGLSATVAPAVYIPLRYLAETGLLQKGSRISYRYYYKFDRNVNVEALVDRLDDRLEESGLDAETVASQKEDTGRSFEDLTRFLSLVSFIALLLGCIGVASSIHIYLKEKISTIAILRCLGTKASQAFLIYLIQVLGIGLMGSVIGAALGIVIQQLLPLVLADVLPMKISTPVAYSAIAQGIGVGILISLLFALSPLVLIRNVSPLNTLRLSFEEKKPARDPLRWLIYGLIVVFVYGFAFLQLRDWRETAVFTISIFSAFLVLAGVASLLMWLIRRFFPSSWNYLWRQGMLNLFRPNNQTVILVIAIGLGTAFISTLFFVQGILLNRVTLAVGDDQPNIVLFDIQNTQREPLLALTRSQGLAAKETVPIVTMRLEEVNGYTSREAEADTSVHIRRRLFSREYRVTYRDTLTPYEEVTEGTWRGVSRYPQGPVYISMEEGFARGAGVKLGDTLTFNIQGAMVPTIVGSFREVDWNRLQTNFLVVFPKGVIEEAPQFHVLLTRVPSTEASARFQQAVVQQFPNVSIIDLALILDVLNDILGKVGFVIRFIAGFSIVTGLVVLIASVLISKYQRIQESVLLRTLGATKKQIFLITVFEYFFLGALAAATGILLALAGSWALARYTFETTFVPEPLPIAGLFFSICLLTIVIGVLNSRDVVSRPPLEILRKE